MTELSAVETVSREHQIFWMLVKKPFRRDDVARVYLAVQSALAHGQKSVDVGLLTTALMPEGRRTMDAACDAIGASGLAYFHWLFDVNLVSTGDGDYHHYAFHRRHDHAETLAWLRTASAPKSLQFRQEYERQRRRLEAKRLDLLSVYSPRLYVAATNEPQPTSSPNPGVYRPMP